MTRKVEAKGINLEKTYEEITDEEYWNIRNILIENNYSTLRNVNPAPPYEYSAHEDRVVNTIENLFAEDDHPGSFMVWQGNYNTDLGRKFCSSVPLNMDLPFCIIRRGDDQPASSELLF